MLISFLISPNITHATVLNMTDTLCLPFNPKTVKQRSHILPGQQLNSVRSMPSTDALALFTMPFVLQVPSHNH